MRVASLTAAAWFSTPCFSLRTFSAAISAARVVVLALISRDYLRGWNDLHRCAPKQASSASARRRRVRRRGGRHGRGGGPRRDGQCRFPGCRLAARPERGVVADEHADAGPARNRRVLAVMQRVVAAHGV